eukprot:TRINITY_DN2986_c2_g1_i2.p1 TRINITY_DN2986_c2_g1~~TRINITY_DN2986_c2_g1_i2.p1  ORF type:complete len:364 (+),score=97.65 TRINITY_DN2986_c2_g1_i2:1003-2094(+)
MLTTATSSNGARTKGGPSISDAASVRPNSHFDAEGEAVVCRSRGNSLVLNIGAASARSFDLFTVRQVDDMAFKQGYIECDCGPIVDSEGFKAVSSLRTLATDGGVRSCPDAESTAPAEARVSAPTSSGRREGSVVANLNADASVWTERTAAVYQKTVCYVREFLAKPNPMVGRSGPTCPFVPMSLRKDLIFMSVIHTDRGVTREWMTELVGHFKQIFLDLEPKSGRLSIYKAIMLIFPDVPDDDAPEVIDRVQFALKPVFVAKGLMIGEFHKNNNATGLRNPNFYPLRTPYPTLAIRHMVPSDLAFLSTEQYAPQVRVMFLESFLEMFADDGATGKVEVDLARSALATARAQLANDEANAASS